LGGHAEDLLPQPGDDVALNSVPRPIHADAAPAEPIDRRADQAGIGLLARDQATGIRADVVILEYGFLAAQGYGHAVEAEEVVFPDGVARRSVGQSNA